MMMRHGGAMNTAMMFAKKGLLGGEVGVPNKWGYLVRSTPLVRKTSTFTANLSDQKDNKNVDKTPPSSQGGAGDNKDEKGITSYWGVQPSKITKPDGTEWKWNCFRVCYVMLYLFCFLRKMVKSVILILTAMGDIQSRCYN